MSLLYQIFSIVYSIVFGFTFYKIYIFLNNYTKRFNMMYKILNTFLIILNFTLLYFLILIKINDGIVNMYIIICIFMGCYLGNKVKLRNVK